MKEYRQSSHTGSLLVWAMLSTAAAVVLFVHSGKIVSRMLRIEEIAGGVALLIFGPVAFAIYIIRARHVWVAVDADRGIVLSGKHVIPWGAIERIERRRPRFRKRSGPAEIPSMKEAGSGCVDLGGCGFDGCFLGLGEAGAAVLIVLAALVAFWLLFFVIVPLLLIPLLEVFAPFGDRITIRARGHKLVLRDLEDAGEFVRAVGRRVPVVER
jgi:hypothetical protein